MVLGNLREAFHNKASPRGVSLDSKTFTVICSQQEKRKWVLEATS